MAYVRHEITVVKDGHDGIARATVTYANDDNQLSVSEFDDAILAACASLNGITDVTATAVRIDENGTAL